MAHSVYRVRDFYVASLAIANVTAPRGSFLSPPILTSHSTPPWHYPPIRLNGPYRPIGLTVVTARERETRRTRYWQKPPQTVVI